MPIEDLSMPLRRTRRGILSGAIDGDPLWPSVRIRSAAARKQAAISSAPRRMARSKGTLRNEREWLSGIRPTSCVITTLKDYDIQDVPFIGTIRFGLSDLSHMNEMRSSTSTGVATGHEVAPRLGGSKPRFREEIAHGNAQGSIYRKVSSAEVAEYSGIRVKLSLPRFEPDPSRFYTARPTDPAYFTGPLDRASMYVGGQAGLFHLDVGFQWMPVYTRNGKATYTDDPHGCDNRSPKNRFTLLPLDKTTRDENDRIVDVRTIVKDDTGETRFQIGELRGTKIPIVLSDRGITIAEGANEFTNFRSHTLRPNFAFRLFWRTSHTDGVSRFGAPQHDRFSPDLVFYPGDKVTLSLVSVDDSHVKLNLRREEVKKSFHYSTMIAQPGFAPHHPKSFKRVVSIDQFRVDADGARRGNERMPALPTRAELWDAVWHQAKIYTPGTGRSGLTPIIGHGFTVERPPDLSRRSYRDLVWTKNYDRKSAEIVSIRGADPR